MANKELEKKCKHLKRHGLFMERPYRCINKEDCKEKIISHNQEPYCRKD